MLNFFRKNTQAIVWAVVIAFVAWGGYAVSIQFEASNRAPGRIFGKEVSYRDYLSAYRGIQIFTPGSKDGGPPDPAQLEARTWQFLVFVREARRRKIRVTDDEVREEIARLLEENKELLLSPGQYARWVQGAFREQPREFEQQLRERLLVRKLFDEVKGQLRSASPPPAPIPSHREGIGTGTAPETPGKPGASSAVKGQLRSASPTWAGTAANPRLEAAASSTAVKKEPGTDDEKELENWIFELIQKAKIEIYKGPSRPL